MLTNVGKSNILKKKELSKMPIAIKICMVCGTEYGRADWPGEGEPVKTHGLCGAYECIRYCKQTLWRNQRLRKRRVQCGLQPLLGRPE